MVRIICSFVNEMPAAAKTAGNSVERSAPGQTTTRAARVSLPEAKRTRQSPPRRSMAMTVVLGR